jgi:hypothetical protein
MKKLAKYPRVLGEEESRVSVWIEKVMQRLPFDFDLRPKPWIFGQFLHSAGDHLR